VLFCWRIDEVRRFVAYLTKTPVFDPNVYFLSQLPADVSLHTTGVIVAMALALSVLATLIRPGAPLGSILSTHFATIEDGQRR
jgi:lipoprotein-releasing system permease protein